MYPTCGNIDFHHSKWESEDKYYDSEVDSLRKEQSAKPRESNIRTTREIADSLEREYQERKRASLERKKLNGANPARLDIAKNREKIENAMMKAGASYSCADCHSVDSIQIDHIIPVSKGGTSCIENLQFLCRRCNLSKGSKLIEKDYSEGSQISIFDSKRPQ